MNSISRGGGFPRAAKIRYARNVIDPACASAVAALERDPFYRCLVSEYSHDEARRRSALAQYFDYSIRQGARVGRVVHLEEADLGVAVWVLPQTEEVQLAEKARKGEFLREVLGERGAASYDRVVTYMSARAASVMGAGSWYLSIIAVAPRAQGRGLGARLLAPTLAEADVGGALCYLETFAPRSVGFYERHGFATRARFDEPTTGAQYALMVRMPISQRLLRQ